MKLLGIDLELTGLHNESDILTLYMGVFDDNFKIIDELDLNLKPDPGSENRSVYSVQPEAMSVNKIDLIQHDSIAITYKQSKTIIYKWIEEMRSKHGPLTPFGNSIQSDINKICERTVNQESWYNHVNRTVIELTSLGAAFKKSGSIPVEQSLSIENMAIYFGKKIDFKRLHEAKYDVELGGYILKNYMEMMN